MIQWLLENFDAAAAFQFGCIVAVAAVVAIFVDMTKRRPAEIGVAEPTEAPLSLLSPERRYELWRKELDQWSKDGTQAGLDALLDRWYGVPHGKPAELWGAGQIPRPPLPVDGDGTGAKGIKGGDLPPLRFFESRPKKVGQTFKWDSEPFTVGELDRLMAGADGAMLRFFERNRKQMASLAPHTLSALKAKAKEFSEPFAGAENAGKYLSLPPQFKTGQWARVVKGPYTGRLAMLFSVWERTCEAAMEPGVGCSGPAFRYEEMEPALPRKGEWWKILACARCSMAGHFSRDAAWTHGPFRMLIDVEPQSLEVPHKARATCGCMVPVNFGRGEEARA